MSASLAIAAFVGGLAGSVGPCAAPRFLAAATLCAGATGARRSFIIAAFAGGLSVSYVLVCTASGALARLSAYSSYTYALLGAACIAAGIATLYGTHHCRARALSSRSYGAAFLSGSVFAGISSPCCGPIAVVAGIGAPGNASSLVIPAAFALGHALPLAGLALGSEKLVRFVHAWPAYATQTVAGALAIAMGGYYCLLA